MLIDETCAIPVNVWFLNDFRICRPRFQTLQSATLEWLADAYLRAKHNRYGTAVTDDNRARMLKTVVRYGCSPLQVKTKAYETSDFGHVRWDDMEVYRLNENPSGVTLGKRMEFFARAVQRVIRQLYEDPHHPAPQEIIYVTSTGYTSPSPIQSFAESRGWGRSTKVSQVYHSGGVGAIPAVRQALGAGIWMKSTSISNPSVDIVHTEMCSLHIDPLAQTPDQQLVHSLFGDGFVRYSVRPAEMFTPGLLVRAIVEEMIPNTAHEMQWLLDPYAFRQQFSPGLAEVLGSAVSDFTDKLFAKAGRQRTDESMFAVYASSPRVLEVFTDRLHLEPKQSFHSRAILEECGDMSGAVLPHIWKAILDDSKVPRGTLVPSIAFGPGLTLSGILLEKVG